MGKRPGSSSKSETACEGKITNDTEVLTTIRKMFEEFKVSIHNEVNELKKSVEFMSNKFDTFCEELTKTKAELRSTQETVKTLSEENDLLKREIMDLQQYTR